MEKVQDVHNYSEVRHKSIQSNLCQIEFNMDVHVISLDINSLTSIYCIREKIHFTNLDLSLSPEDLRTELIHLTITTIKSKETTPKEQALVNFTGINMKRLSTWDEQ